MTTNEMKKILHDKLKEENCYFTLSDIKITKKDYNHISIVIKDYEHIPFTMGLFIDDIFGYVVTIKNEFTHEILTFAESKNDYDIKTALVDLGYYIGTQF